MRRFRWARSLVTRLALVTLLIGLIAGTAGAAVIRGSARDALRRETARQNFEVARSLADEIDTRISTLENELSLVASQPRIKDLSPAPGDLEAALRTSGNFDELYLLDRVGTTVAAASTQRLLEPSEVDVRTGLVDAFESNPEGVVSLTGTAAPTVEIAVPVENPPGSVIGAIVGQFPLELLATRLSARALSPSAKVLVVGTEGTILFHPERNRVLEQQSYPLQTVTQEADRVATLRRDGTDVVAAAFAASLLPGSVIVEEDESDAFARVGEELEELTLLLALTIGLVLVAIVLVGIRLLRPLQGLERTVRRFAEGDRSARAEVKGSSEMRTLAEEFNHMADSLDERLAQLEEAQAELRALEERFRTAFEEAPVPMALANVEGVYRMVNSAFCELLGRSESDLVGTNWRDYTHPDDLDTSEQALADAFRTGARSYQLEKRYVRRGGSEIWVLLSVAFAGGVDRPRYFIAHLIDLTERREAEGQREALLQQTVAAEERLRLVLESAPDATIVVSSAGRIEFLNGRVAEMFGYQSDELLGREVEVLLPDALRSRHVQHREGYVVEPQTRPMGIGLELSGRRKDGSEFPVEISLSPLRTEEGVQVIAAIRDVTERRKAEEVAHTLREMRMRQRQAIELNDNVIQGLTLAKWSYELGQLEEAERAVERTLESARALIDEMLSEGLDDGIRPGDLVRERPAEFG